MFAGALVLIDGSEEAGFDVEGWLVGDDERVDDFADVEDTAKDRQPMRASPQPRLRKVSSVAFVQTRQSRSALRFVGP